MSEDFFFDMKSKKMRKTDAQLLESLRDYSQTKDGVYFTTKDYDAWENKLVGSDVISSRFGSWKKALAIIGVNGCRERRYTDKELMDNLETVWRTINYPPGKRIISKYGEGISEHPYKQRWGSLKKACELLSQYKNGTIEWEVISPIKTISEPDTPSLLTRRPLRLELRFNPCGSIPRRLRRMIGILPQIPRCLRRGCLLFLKETISNVSNVVIVLRNHMIASYTLTI